MLFPAPALAATARYLSAGQLLFNMPQGSKVIREIGGLGIEHLNASVVLPVESSNGARTASILCVLRRVEPQAQMVSMDRFSCRTRRPIRIPIGRHIVKHYRRWHVTWRLRHDEGLNIEPADEPLMANAILVGLDITLVPR